MLFSMLVPGDNFRVRENQFSESLWGASISDIKRKLKKKKKKGKLVSPYLLCFGLQLLLFYCYRPRKKEKNNTMPFWK